jgi:hypothetical protein
LIRIKNDTISVYPNGPCCQYDQIHITTINKLASLLLDYFHNWL